MHSVYFIIQMMEWVHRLQHISLFKKASKNVSLAKAPQGKQSFFETFLSIVEQLQMHSNERWVGV